MRRIFVAVITIILILSSPLSSGNPYALENDIARTALSGLSAGLENNAIISSAYGLEDGTATSGSYHQQKDAVISGEIKNPKAPTITINKQSVDLNSGGQFSYSVNLKKPAYVEINFGKKISLYLKPGDTIALEIDATADLKSIKLNGDSEEINRFLIRTSYESEELTKDFNKIFRKTMALDEKAYTDKIDSLWQPFETALAKFTERHAITDEYFLKTQRASLLYSRANILLKYPDWHRQVSGDSSYLPSDTYLSFLDGLDLNDPELIDLEEYKTFVVTYLDYKSQLVLKASPEFINLNYKPFRAKMKTALETFTHPAVRTDMLYSFMKPMMIDYYHKGIDDLIQAFKQNCSNQDYIDEIEMLYKQDKAIRDACTIKTYKTVGDVDLDVFIYRPPNPKKGDKRPAIAFFHGGGWECGKPEWGHMQCEHFASLGLAAFSFEYRLSTQHDTTPIECLADAKSAIRWIREHAEDLGVDPERIVGSGFSAGGHLVLCTAMVEGYNEPGEDVTISPAVNAMLLWVTPGKIFPGWFPSLLKGKADWKEFDPAQLVRPGLPPAVMFQGTADDQVPAWTARGFSKMMRDDGNRCDLHIYEGQTHLNWGDNAKDVLQKMDKFLESLGYLKSTKN